MDEIRLLIAADAIPAAVADAVSGLADVREWRPAVRTKQELARYVHWDGDPGDVPVRLASLTASLPDDDAAAEALRRVHDALGDDASAAGIDVAVGRSTPIVDRAARPGTVRASYIFRKLPQLPMDEFRTHWRDVHGQLWARVPGVVRYLQYHPLAGAGPAPQPPRTHDGWSDVWFQDLEHYAAALSSPERITVSADGATLLDYASLQIFVTREG